MLRDAVPSNALAVITGRVNECLLENAHGAGKHWNVVQTTNNKPLKRWLSSGPEDSATLFGTSRGWGKHTD